MSLVSNINYVSGLDNQYGYKAKVYKSNLALGTNLCDVTFTAEIYNANTKLVETYTRIATGITAAGISSYISGLKADIETKGYSIVLTGASTIVIGGVVNSTTVDIDVEMSKAQSVYVMKYVKLEVTSGSIIDYTIVGEMSDTLGILPYFILKGDEILNDTQVIIDNLTEVSIVAGLEDEIKKLGEDTGAVRDGIVLLGKTDVIEDMRILSEPGVVGDIEIVSDNYVSVKRVADELNANENIETIADDLELGSESEIRKVNLLKPNVDIVAGDTVAINTIVVPANLAALHTVANDLALGEDGMIDRVYESIDEIDRVFDSITQVDYIGNDLALVDSTVKKVAVIDDEVVTVAGIDDEVVLVAGVSTQVGLLGNVDTVADLAMLATTDIVSDMAMLAVTGVLNDMNTLATTVVVTNMQEIVDDVIPNMAEILAADDNAGIATTKAGEALASELKAKDWATKATEVETGLYSAKYYAEQAAITYAGVESIMDNFDDIYLGAKIMDPNMDNDGNALVAGQLYWNTTESEIRFYNGSIWERPEYSASQSAIAALASEKAAAVSAALATGMIVDTEIRADKAYSSEKIEAELAVRDEAIGVNTTNIGVVVDAMAGLSSANAAFGASAIAINIPIDGSLVTVGGYTIKLDSSDTGIMTLNASTGEFTFKRAGKYTLVTNVYAKAVDKGPTITPRIVLESNVAVSAGMTVIYDDTFGLIKVKKDGITFPMTVLFEITEAMLTYVGGPITAKIKMGHVETVPADSYVQVIGFDSVLSTMSNVYTGFADHNQLTGTSAADVHPASSITVTPSGTIVSTNVGAAISELDTKIQNAVASALAFSIALG